MAFLATLVHLRRLARAGFVLAREGVFKDIDSSLLPPELRPALALAKLIARRGASGADGIAPAIARLGPSYVKLGQFLATRSDIVGARAVRELEKLQDRAPPFPREQAVKQIEAAFGRPLGEVFAEFGEPVAAASIAQVHRAKVIDGDGLREVAVKVLRPGVARRFRRDLADMFFAAHWAERRSAEARRLKVVQVVDTLARSVKMEMDFRLEAAAASEFAERVQNDSDFHVPEVDWDRTSAEVMTLDWIAGVPLSDEKALAASGQDLRALGRIVIQSFLRHALRDGFFHADMHQGNLFLDPQGRLAAVDFGIMGRLGLKERRFLAEILYGFITRDYHRVAVVHFEAGYVPRTHRVEDFAQAIRAIGEPIHARTADQISMAKLLTLLFEITAIFDMETRTELVMLQKTMVVVEGVARRLDPHLNIWSTSEPVVRGWIEENLGPRGKIEDLGRGLAAFAKAAAEAPALFDRVERLAARLEQASPDGAVPIQQASIEALARAEARTNKWRTMALWVIATALLIIAFA